jgi:hypothetical protein
LHAVGAGHARDRCGFFPRIANISRAWPAPTKFDGGQFEDLLLKMGEKNSDGGQFFTPRKVIRGIVHVLDPQAGETVYVSCCGNEGFLAVAFEHINRNLGNTPASRVLDTLKHDTFFGRGKEALAALEEVIKNEEIYSSSLLTSMTNSPASSSFTINKIGLQQTAQSS